MTKPKNFSQNSDYATTQGDDGGSITYLIPAGTVIPAFSTRVFEASRVIGTRNAYLRTQGSTTNAPGRWFAGLCFVSEANLSLAGVGPVAWPIYHTLERSSPSSLRAYCELVNNTNLAMTINTAQTITWDVRTYLSPFPQ